MAGTPPYRWLLAESLAWPLAAEEAFDQQCIALARQHTGTMNGDDRTVRATRHLAEALDAWLQPRARGWSLEALRNLRERWWFDAGERRVPLAGYLQRIASAHLAFDGARIRLAHSIDGTAGPHTEHSHAERVMRWRMLSLCLPADLLVAAVAAERDITPAADHVDICSSELTRLLEAPVAETHLHVGAALRFPVLWTGLMSHAHELGAHERKLQRGGTPPFGSGARFVEKLLTAAVARWIMARFLRHAGPAVDITQYASDARRLSDIAWAGGAADLGRRLLHVLAWLVTRAPHNEREVLARIAEIKVMYRALRASLRQRGGPGGNADDGEYAVALRDPVAPWFAPSRRGALPETHLTACALAYLASHGASDERFARLFWQYQRVRTQCFRFLTLRPGTEGLDWFRRHYDRISVLRAPVDAHKYRLALETEGRGLSLAAIEMRTAPEREWYANLREVRAVVEQTRTTSIEVGLILHWIKARDCSRCGRHVEDPRHVPFLSRYGSWFHHARTQAAAVARMLDERPGTLRVLRGLDVANVELSVGTWVTVPLIHHVREASRRAAHRLALGGEPVPPIHVTCHAGEEYRRLVEGLRRVHELIEFCVLVRGDRVGHGLVLGENPSLYQQVRSLVPQPSQERLDDLLWEWERYAREDVVPPSGREAVVRQLALEIGRKIYSDPVTFDELVEARRLRHQPAMLERLGYPHCRPELRPPSGPLLLLHRYLTDPQVFERGQLVMEVRATEQETAALVSMQTWLRRTLSACAISVESNPSSNWLIADMDEVRSHPSLILQPLPGDAAPAGAALALSISSDDPLTFATCLADEYAYLHAALMHAGVASPEALRWLDQARRAAWTSRFTIPSGATSPAPQAGRRT